MIFWYAPKRFWDIINQAVEEKLDGITPENGSTRFDYIKSLRIPTVPTPTIEPTKKGKTILLVGLVLLTFLATSDR